MQDNVNDIFSSGNRRPADDEIMRYLEQKLSDEEAHGLEKNTLADPFSADALEGLQSLPAHENLAGTLHELKRDLHRKVERKKRSKTNNGQLNWISYTAIILLLVLAILGYFVIRKYYGH